MSLSNTLGVSIIGNSVAIGPRKTWLSDAFMVLEMKDISSGIELYVVMFRAISVE
jgi:hypothetical protein